MDNKENTIDCNVLDQVADIKENIVLKGNKTFNKGLYKILILFFNYSPIFYNFIFTDLHIDVNENTSTQNLSVPEAFQKALVWPSDVRKQKKKKTTKRKSTVLTSEEWQEEQEKIQQEKLRKQKEIEERKKLREEKKVRNAEEKRAKKNTIEQKKKIDEEIKKLMAEKKLLRIKQET